MASKKRIKNGANRNRNTKRQQSGQVGIAEGDSFKARVLTIVARIPKGKTMTYGEVAEWAGSPGASRAVGNIMSHNWNPKIPCHRVIRSDGKLGSYNRGGERSKMKLLRKEGAIK